MQKADVLKTHRETALEEKKTISSSLFALCAAAALTLSLAGCARALSEKKNALLLKARVYVLGKWNKRKSCLPRKRANEAKERTCARFPL